MIKRTRDEIIAGMRDKIKNKKPIAMGSCGTGLTAKLLEKAGFDAVSPFGGGKLRSNGWGSMYQYWPVYDANGELYDLCSKSVIPILKGDAFVLACINGNDPNRDMGFFLKQLKDAGVMGVLNVPSITAYDKDSEIYQILTQSGITLEQEIEVLAKAKEMGMITATMPFDIEDSLKTIKEADVDIFCFHAGTTKGGLIGFDTKSTLEDTANRTEEANKEALKIKSNLILLSHGASLVTPEDGQYIVDNTSCHGVFTGSATERIPIENAILDIAGKFANLKMK
jgi:predicted TIM-barrel enzyme